MHRVGRDGLEGLNIANYGIENGNVVVFCFGQIDVHNHIGKQSDKQQRSISDIIIELTHNFFKTILNNLANYTNTICVICSVTPPINRRKWYGTLAERVIITKELNRHLEIGCQKHRLLFLDFYDLFSNQNGEMMPEMSDGEVHVDPALNYLIKARLLKLLYG